MIKFTHVYKTYPGPTHALQDINIFIEKGEFIFLVGPSGAGKTTFFKMMSAFDKPTSGEVSVMGYSINRLTVPEVPLFRRRIGVVFQDFRLLKGRSIFENVALPLLIQSERPNIVSKRVEEMLDLVSLKYKVDQPVDQLSGGEQQRVSIARALIHKPNLLIADEPTGNLDPEMTTEIMNLFERANSQGTTVVIATHDIHTVQKMQKRVLKLKSGQIAELGSRDVAENTMG